MAYCLKRSCIYTVFKKKQNLESILKLITSKVGSDNHIRRKVKPSHLQAVGHSRVCYYQAKCKVYLRTHNFIIRLLKIIVTYIYQT